MFVMFPSNGIFVSFGRFRRGVLWNILPRDLVPPSVSFPRANMTDDALTSHDIAEVLKVTEKNVYGLAQQSRIPGFKVGGQWRFRRRDLEAWIDEQKKG